MGHLNLDDSIPFGFSSVALIVSILPVCCLVDIVQLLHPWPCIPQTTGAPGLELLVPSSWVNVAKLNLWSNAPVYHPTYCMAIPPVPRACLSRTTVAEQDEKGKY